MSLKKGDIVLVPFPFTDLSTTKLRPAVVLWVESSGNDVTVCFISSQHLNRITSEEFLIAATHEEFTETGLKLSSKVRVSRIVTLTRSLISRRIGQLGTNLMEMLDDCLKQTFQLK
jgi:mRNA interferase MazF